MFKGLIHSSFAFHRNVAGEFHISTGIVGTFVAMGMLSDVSLVFFFFTKNARSAAAEMNGADDR